MGLVARVLNFSSLTFTTVISAKAGIHLALLTATVLWIPAFVEMTALMLLALRPN